MSILSYLRLIHINQNLRTLKINKFGFDIYSDFNKKIQKKNSLEIISEFTTNHQGNTDKL